jgi:hypothetical protein
VNRVTRTPISALSIRAHQSFKDENRTFARRHDCSRRKAQRSRATTALFKLNSRPVNVLYFEAYSFRGCCEEDLYPSFVLESSFSATLASAANQNGFPAGGIAAKGT